MFGVPQLYITVLFFNVLAVYTCRYNNFQHDPLSSCKCTPPYSAENGIAARSDLNPADGTYPLPALGHRAHGAIDMKVGTAFDCLSNLFTNMDL